MSATFGKIYYSNIRAKIDTHISPTAIASASNTSCMPSTYSAANPKISSVFTKINFPTPKDKPSNLTETNNPTSPSIAATVASTPTNITPTDTTNSYISHSNSTDTTHTMTKTSYSTTADTTTNNTNNPPLSITTTPTSTNA